MTKLTVPLSRAGIRRAREVVEAYGDTVDRLASGLCSALAEFGLEAALANVPVDTGELRDGIGLYRRGDRRWAVVAKCGHAAFVEYGTGVVGEGTYKGELPSVWEYSVGPMIDDEGWWYYVDAEGEGHWTQGQPAQGFMALTAEQVRRAAPAIAREVFA